MRSMIGSTFNSDCFYRVALRVLNTGLLLPVQRTRNYLFDKFGLKLDLHRKRPKWPGEEDRYSYQKRYVTFPINHGDRVLDVGNGGHPFPYATVVMDRFPGLTACRQEPLITNEKPFLVADVHDLPFGDKSFDFVYCSHVLELVDDPLRACEEIMRVGRRGYIETPTLGKDMLFAWAKGMQKWHVVAIAETLCFFEYSERQLEGIRSSIWRDLIMNSRANPIQEAFFHNLDIFNVMFTWNNRFSVLIFRLDGTIHGPVPVAKSTRQILMNEYRHAGFERRS